MFSYPRNNPLRLDLGLSDDGVRSPVSLSLSRPDDRAFFFFGVRKSRLIFAEQCLRFLLRFAFAQFRLSCTAAWQRLHELVYFFEEKMLQNQIQHQHSDGRKTAGSSSISSSP